MHVRIANRETLIRLQRVHVNNARLFLANQSSPHLYFKQRTQLNYLMSEIWSNKLTCTKFVSSGDFIIQESQMRPNKYEPRSDKRDLLAIKVKSEIFKEKERPSCCEQLQKI